MFDFLPLTEQMRILFESVQHPDGRPYTLQEVSDQVDISVATLSQMRTGKIKNPQLHTLRELGRFFNVPLRYFETRTPEECYTILAEKDQPASAEINEIAFRASNLSPEAQKDVLMLIKWAQAAEEQRKRDGTLPPPPNLQADQTEDESNQS